MILTNKKLTLALLPAAAILVTAVLPAQAGILHKHPVAAGAAAGLAAHHFAKKGAAGRAANGQRPNLAERHPVVSGVAAGVAAHHILKKH